MSSELKPVLIYITQGHLETDSRTPLYDYYCRTCPDELRTELYLDQGWVRGHPVNVRTLKHNWAYPPAWVNTDNKLARTLRDAGFLLVKDLPNIQLTWKKLKVLEARELEHVLRYCGITEINLSGKPNARTIEAIVLHPNELRRLEGQRGTIPDWLQTKAWPDPK